MTASQTKLASTVSTHRSIVQLITHSKNIPDNRSPKHRDTSGWEGFVSLGCGILGVFVFFPAFAAIVFGIRGLRHDKRYRGLSLAGLIVGILDILVWAAAVVFMLIIGGFIVF